MDYFGLYYLYSQSFLWQLRKDNMCERAEEMFFALFPVDRFRPSWYHISNFILRDDEEGFGERSFQRAGVWCEPVTMSSKFVASEPDGRTFRRITKSVEPPVSLRKR